MVMNATNAALVVLFMSVSVKIPTVMVKIPVLALISGVNSER